MVAALAKRVTIWILWHKCVDVYKEKFHPCTWNALFQRQDDDDVFLLASYLTFVQIHVLYVTGAAKHTYMCNDTLCEHLCIFSIGSTQVGGSM